MCAVYLHKAASPSTQEPTSITSERERLVKMLDAEYQAANLPEVVGQTDNINGLQKSGITTFIN